MPAFPVECNGKELCRMIKMHVWLKYINIASYKNKYFDIFYGLRSPVRDSCNNRCSVALLVRVFI